MNQLFIVDFVLFIFIEYQQFQLFLIIKYVLQEETIMKKFLAMILAFVLTYFLSINVIYIVIICGVIGAVFMRPKKAVKNK